MHGVIFDMDGVLADSNETHFKAFIRMGEELGVPFPRTMLERSFGMHNNQIFPMWLGADLTQPRIDALADRKEALYRELARDTLQPVAGAVDLFNVLHRAGWRLAVASSGPGANVRLALDVLGLAGRLDAVVTGDDVTHGKPAPDVFLLALQGLALPATRCVVVEDAPNGVEAARAAGIAVVAVTTSKPAHALANADLIVETLAELGPQVLLDVMQLRRRP
ncbi:MAG: HAD family hydrolase [Myxococcota bacterium]